MRQSQNARWLLLLVLCAIAVALWASRYDQGRAPVSIEQFLSRIGARGAVLAVRETDGRIYVRAFGQRFTQPGRPMPATTQFPLASLSKPITGAAVRRLINQEKLGLDDSVAALLPEVAQAAKKYPGYADISIRHLLQHTSGLSQHAGDPLFNGGEVAGCEHAILKTLRRPLESDPGARMRYSNTGYCLLGRVIEQTTGLPYASAAPALLELPGKGLSFGPPPSRVHEGEVLLDQEWESLGAAGGWFGDAPTIVSVLAREAMDRGIRAPATTKFTAWYYGLGWRVWPLGTSSYRLTHFGVIRGTFTMVLAYPDGRAAVMLMNANPKDPETSAAQLMRLLDRIRWGPIGPDRHSAQVTLSWPVSCVSQTV